MPGGNANPRAGWHRICSLFSCIDLCDELALTPLPRGLSRFSIRWADGAPVPSEIDWPIEEDLTFRAHAMAEALVGRELPVEVVLTKRIPVGGGMGGGSSNAAAMLRGLSELFGLDPASLPLIGAKLGSDVPFFLDAEARVGEPARPALVEGFGERMTRRTPIRSDIVLICPPLACPTPAVYRAFDRHLLEVRSFRFREPEARTIFESSLPLRSQALFNDLTEPALAVAPALREIHACASKVISPIHVTGSGSTLFALVPESGASTIVDSLRAALSSRAAIVHTALR